VYREAIKVKGMVSRIKLSKPPPDEREEKGKISKGFAQVYIISISGTTIKALLQGNANSVYFFSFSHQL